MSVQPRSRAIQVGPLTVMVSMPIGSLLTRWAADAITAVYDPDLRPEFPERYPAVYDKNLRKRMDEAKAGDLLMFNGTTYALRDYRVSVPDPVTEDTHLQLRLGPTCFFDYLATNFSAASADLPLELLRTLPGRDISEIPLSNQLAMNFSVITADGMLLCQRRSARVANFPLQLANGINGTMQRGVDGHQGDETSERNPDPIGCVLRECAEEIGITPDRKDVTVYGIVIDHRYFQPLMIGEVRLPLTAEEIQSAAMAWARDKFEYTSFEVVPLTAGPVVRSLMTDTWVPVCAAATLASVIQHSGRAAVERSLVAFEKVVIA
ncbi:hypothetical protein GCM10027589_23260 [Actinocorallia lasiicapitis]